MSTPGTPPAAGSTGAAAGGRGGGRWWLIPALTFVVGLLLGGVVMGVSRDTGPSDPVTAAGGGAAATAAPTSGAGVTSPAPGASGDVTVTVPRECAALSEDAQQAATLLTQAADAARALDAGKLADIVRQMGQVRTDLERRGSACQQAAVPSLG